MWNAHEPPADLFFLPTFFNEPQVRDRMIQTELDGYLVLGLPDGVVPNEPCNPNTIPLDAMFGTQQVQGLDQIQYYPADANTTRFATEPLLFPDKLLHRIVRIG